VKRDASVQRFTLHASRFTTMSPAGRARLALLAGAVLFSTGGAAIKLTAMNAWQVASLRSAIAALVLAAALRVRPRDFDRTTLPVAIAYAGAMVFFVLGNKLTTAANTIFLQSTAPLYVLLLGPRWLGEPNRRSDLLIMALMVIGLGCVLAGTQPVLASAPDPPRGNLFALASGGSWALTVLGLRWIGRDPGRSAGPALVSGNLVACALTLPFALPVSAAALDWAVVAYLGVFQIAGAYLLVTAGLRRLTALEGILLLLVEPVLNPLWAALIHGERPGGWALIGGAIVLGATLLKSVVDRDAPRAA
jgi:drug/metabolite transporter (DMT)-like permease